MLRIFDFLCTIVHSFRSAVEGNGLYYYKNGNLKGHCQKKTFTVKTKNSGKGTFVKVPMVQLMKHKGKNYYYNALKGTFTTKWFRSGKVNATTLSCNYGHATIKVDPSVSFPGGGSIGFGPGMGYGYEATKNVRR